MCFYWEPLQHQVQGPPDVVLKHVAMTGLEFTLSYCEVQLHSCSTWWRDVPTSRRSKSQASCSGHRPHGETTHVYPWASGTGLQGHGPQHSQLLSGVSWRVLMGLTLCPGMCAFCSLQF